MAKKQPVSTPRPTDDPELYCSELDWYWNSYHAACELKSIGVGLEIAYDMSLPDGTERVPYYPPDPDKPGYVEHQLIRCTGSSGAHGTPDPWADTDKVASFGYGRFIWARLARLPWSWTEALRGYYEAMQPDHDGGRCRPSIALVRAAHAAYLRKLWPN